jgi:hypothetical protein
MNNHYPFTRTINSLADFEQLIARAKDYSTQYEFNKQRGHLELLFRGESSAKFKLKPSIARNLNKSVLVRDTEKRILLDFYQLLHQKGIFKNVQKPLIDYAFGSEWLLIQQAQHFGLPTRLLDWTTCYEVALFFAVEDEKYHKIDGHVWLYLAPENISIGNSETKHLTIHPQDFKKTFFLYTPILWEKDYLIKIAHRRKVRQFGKFLIQSYSQSVIPLNKQSQHYPFLFEIIIPANLKQSILSDLQIKKVTRDALFVNEELTFEVIKIIEEIVKSLKTKYNL